MRQNKLGRRIIGNDESARTIGDKFGKIGDEEL
jgi:hypothetical protein